MRVFVSLILATCISSCSYYRPVGINENTPASEVAVVTIAKFIAVSEINGMAADPYYGTWSDGAHTIKMPPGNHTFKIKYNAVSRSGGYSAKNWATISANLSAGKQYDLFYKLDGTQLYYGIRQKN